MPVFGALAALRAQTSFQIMIALSDLTRKDLRKVAMAKPSNELDRRIIEMAQQHYWASLANQSQRSLEASF